MESMSVGAEFMRTFDVQLAQSQKQKDAVFYIRHQVYCDELSWEARQQTQLERDEYDNHSIHCLLQHKPSKQYVGCIRLIIPSPHSSLTLPSQDQYGGYLKTSLLLPLLQSGTLSECSRLALLPEVRRQNNNSYRQGEASTLLQLTYQHTQLMSVSLYFCCIALAKAHQCRGTLLLANSKLTKHLKMLGLTLTRLSEDIEHRGCRAVYHFDTHEFKAQQLRSDVLSDLYLAVERRLSQQLNNTELACELS
ncbi:PEP-CTERM/exosortase system-associated acyltransferase [Pseudoalteromonas rubra]|uniref:PEP-CTERM/exosortase system-associated acyltransferase n=1 Tax=Pseudoalteromonas rubra TaxID=43658 RepID=A0A5S3UPR7_9GAMM|nr:PEP-CTERM/exosortase system-associated acyltransferase [Pseudoalteromonas rubra]QPB83421.1 PEP-CTERM/exosortase system-associated acyltransferase [Pseudoalteromonas rubra]